MIQKAKAKLILFYGIDNPTDKQVAEFLLFGKINIGGN